MIRISKVTAPKRLSEGVNRTEIDCLDFDSYSNEYKVGKRKMEFDRRIYGHDCVKKALLESQHQKCCYCEAKFLANSHGDVEHYRPKGAVRQGKGSSPVKPGYYWMAYRWENLYFCCEICNRSHKRDLFPLRHPHRRSVSHHDDLKKEEPLILDPGGNEDPRDHITFRQELAVGRTCEGKTTIEMIGLNRPDLCERRLGNLKKMKTLRKIVLISKDTGPPGFEKLAEEAKLALEKHPCWKSSPDPAFFRLFRGFSAVPCPAVPDLSTAFPTGGAVRARRRARRGDPGRPAGDSLSVPDGRGPACRQAAAAAVRSSHIRRSRRRALAVTTSLRMTATGATLWGFPLSRSRWYSSLMSGEHLLADSAAI